MSTRIPFQWGNANFSWESNPFPNQSKYPFKWSDCALILELVQAGGAYNEVLNDKEKTNRFIKLLCQVEGKEYKETKEVVDRQIRITDIALVAKEVLGINIKIDL